MKRCCIFPLQPYKQLMRDWTFVLLFCFGTALFGQEGTRQAKVLWDLEFGKADGLPLTLDLYVPRVPRPTVLVYVHGGAWRSGSKSEMPLKALVEEGYPVASIEYRLSTVARFPAQIHDIKAAVRFLRTQGKDYDLEIERIVIAGSSAGGHLAALAGLTNGNRELEESRITNGGSSKIDGIISFYGASNLTTILAQSTPHGLKVRVPALELLLGGQPDQKPELARLASPVFHVDPKDPPLLLLHGDQDPQMPINQSHELCGAYQKAGLAVQFEVVHGAAHGGAIFYDDERMRIVKEFLARHFK